MRDIRHVLLRTALGWAALTSMGAAALRGTAHATFAADTPPSTDKKDQEQYWSNGHDVLEYLDHEAPPVLQPGQDTTANADVPIELVGIGLVLLLCGAALFASTRRSTAPETQNTGGA